MADQSTFVEMDTFTVKMLRNVDERRRKLDALFNDDPTLSTNHPTTSEPQTDSVTSPPLSPTGSEGSFHELPDEPEVSARMRRSISALLNIQKDIFSSEEDIIENSEHLENVKERFNEVVNLYSDLESHEKSILTESTNIGCVQSSLSNKNDTSSKDKEDSEPGARLGFKERMSVLARGYYPSQEQEFVKPKPVQSIAKSSATPSKGIQSDYFPQGKKPSTKENASKIEELKNTLSSQMQTDQQFQPSKAPNFVFARKTSVNDLKNIFESKSENSISKPEMAPELLSLKDKKRLFEKAIREETAASKKAQEMCLKPKKRIVDWQPTKETNEEGPKRKKSVDSMIGPAPEIVDPLPREVQNNEAQRTSLTLHDMSVEEENNDEIEKDHQADVSDAELSQDEPEHQSEDEQEDHEVSESILTHSRIIEDTTIQDDDDDELAKSCQIIDEAFQGIDVPETLSQASSKNGVEETMDITFSALDNDFRDDANLQRSSTRVNLSSEKVQPLTPSKPPRTFAYNENSLQKGKIPEDSEEAPPMRTISFYRREQKLKKELAQSPGGALDSPVRILKQNILPANPETHSSFQMKITKKIEALADEIKEHNRISSQASTALNISLSCPDSSLGPRIEAERILLIASEKRNACMEQIKRYQFVKKNFDQVYPIYCENSSKAIVNISNIKIPFKNEFLVSRAKGKTTTCFYFTCLLVCNGVVHVSELLSSNDNIGKDFLEFKFLTNFIDLTEDFQISLKLFCLELNNEIKNKERNKTFRIKFGTSSLRGSQKKAPSVPDQSSNFKMVGQIKLSLPILKGVKSASLYRMDLATLSTPVDGYVTMSVHMDVNHHIFAEGFFDIQEESTSFWNLRYFILSDSQLKFWRFKDDMKDKKPLSVIELKHCINPRLSLLQGTEREVCMRPNTFVLVTVDPPKVSNTEKLLKGGVIQKVHPEKYIISSPSKEDSTLFCAQLNQVLRNIRVWSNDCVRPYSFDEFNRLLQDKK